MEVRLERLRPEQVEKALSRASVAYVPIGSVEYHGPHLPLGVDMMTAHGLCIDAARESGGVVLPPAYLVNGCLDFPYTLTFTPALVEQWTNEIVTQLHGRGVQLVVLVTGHGPLDLIHLLKRVAGEHSGSVASAYGLCWLELNAALLSEPVSGEPTVIDHASTIETSWIQALEPSLVETAMLPDDPDVTIPGVYGRNPRFTATPEIGDTQRLACASLLGSRCQQILEGTWHDRMDDLATFVDYTWSEPLEVSKIDHEGPGMRIAIRNPGRASRFVTGLGGVYVGDAKCDLTGAFLLNETPGEAGLPVPIDTLSREIGVYVRRGQTMLLVLECEPNTDDRGPLQVCLQLGGVRDVKLSE